MSSDRLVAAPQIDYAQQWPFYVPGVVLTLAMFTFGVPYMFYQITHRHVGMYQALDIYKLDKADQDKLAEMRKGKGRLSRRIRESVYTPEEIDDLWARRVRRSTRNRAKNLYGDFKYQWRYWKLILLVIKFAVVVIDVLKTVFGDITVAPILMLFVHTCNLILLVFARPYYDNRPDMLSMAISFANIFNYCLVLTMAMRIEAPSFMIYVVVVVNLAFPIISLFIGWYLNVRRERNRKKKIKEKKRQYLPLAEVNKKRRKIERLINESTLRFLASWTWGVLITTVIAGELIFIGTFAEAALTPVSGHTASNANRTDVVRCYQEEYSRNQEFLGYPDWKEFTDNCCCMSRSNVSDVYDLDGHITELWACQPKTNAASKMSIMYKERQRRNRDASSKVHLVRGFCDTTFKDFNGVSLPTLEPVFNKRLGKLGIQWTNGTFVDDYW